MAPRDGQGRPSATRPSATRQGDVSIGGETAEAKDMGHRELQGVRDQPASGRWVTTRSGIGGVRSRIVARPRERSSKTGSSRTAGSRIGAAR